jgi:hypothetical protein
MTIGIFPVDSHIAEVLFDTGATHSFITASWVEALIFQSLPCQPPSKLTQSVVEFEPIVFA